MRKTTMMRIVLYVLLISLAFASYSLAAERGEKTGAAKGQIIVVLKNFYTDKGVALVDLFSSKEGYPSDKQKAFRRLKCKVRKKTCRVSFDDIPHGIYAVSVIHDENSNGTLDKNWMGIPKEGMGASNKAKGKFGPPSFEDAIFPLESDRRMIEIDIHYIFR